jgi:hypothetical protein
MRFRALDDFWCEELKSQYAKGLTYTVHYPTSRLARYANRWLEEGKIEEVIGSAATISGSDKPKPKTLLKRIFPWL